ncbi:hypothetical protein EDC01DRAFT_630694 [Geopyxis carbonaria]|nr:hypothetical protein EDC01DRAFT_630694 [Geopyxis carbonaria]
MPLWHVALMASSASCTVFLSRAILANIQSDSRMLSKNRSCASKTQIAVWSRQNLVKKKAMLLKQQQERQDVIRQQGSGWDIPAVAKNVKNFHDWCSVDVAAILTNRRQGGLMNIPGHELHNMIKRPGSGSDISIVPGNGKTWKYIPSPMDWEALTPGWTIEQFWNNGDKVEDDNLDGTDYEDGW